MNLEELKAKGGFVALAPIKKKVVWKRKKDGVDVEDTFDIHIMRKSFGVMEMLLDDVSDRSKGASYISETVRLGENAEERMTYAEAYALDPSLAGEFVKAINEVNKDSEKN